ncbi:MAG: tRNA lysidine(34) synthetase TilS [Planctomycetota bacterium]|nr:tRNA lysidine(34) synthetase TilS [Planctomycetota bacterium]
MNSAENHNAFLTNLLAGLRNCRFAEGRILVAVSGGADSVALLQGLVHLKNRETRRSASAVSHLEFVVGHIDHQIRAESMDDARWVRSLADSTAVRCRIETADVPGRVTETGESLEEAARRSRYEALVRIANDEGCDAIAVAHTADDQAETVLHHLIRGTSVTGLRGMLWNRPVADTDNVRLIRPLLNVRREDIEAWLADIGQDFRTDTTNSDETLTRNRIRHQLLPLLEQEFNPQVRRVLGTLAVQAAEVSNLVRGLADKLANEALIQNSENSLRIDCQTLANQPSLLIRETLLTVWQRAGWPLKRMGHREWQILSDLVTQASGAVSLPERISAQRRGQLIVLSRDSADLISILPRD